MLISYCSFQLQDPTVMIFLYFANAYLVRSSSLKGDLRTSELNSECQHLLVNNWTNMSYYAGRLNTFWTIFSL